MKIRCFITIVVIVLTMISCSAETSYRDDINPYVKKYNEAFMAFQIFLKMNHIGKEIEAEKDLDLIYEQLNSITKDIKEIKYAAEPGIIKFHRYFENTLTFTKKIVDDYRQKFRVQISVINIEAEYADIFQKLEIAKRNFQGAQTSSGKNTYRERIVTMTQELDTCKKNLESTHNSYKELLVNIVSSEDFYISLYPEIVKYGKTSIMVSLFPPPKYLISPEEKEKYIVKLDVTEEADK